MFNFLNLRLYFWHGKQGNMHHLGTVLGFLNQNLLACASLKDFSSKALIAEPKLFIISLCMQPRLHRDVSSG